MPAALDGSADTKPQTWQPEDKEGAIAALAQEERGHLAEWLAPGHQVEGTWEAGDPREIACPCLIPPLARPSDSEPPQPQPLGPPGATQHPGLWNSPNLTIKDKTHSKGFWRAPVLGEQLPIY